MANWSTLSYTCCWNDNGGRGVRLIANERNKRQTICPENSNELSGTLQRAAHDGDLEKVKFLVLTCKAELNTINGHRQSTALQEAAYQGKIDVIKFLDSQGADPNLPKVSYCMRTGYSEGPLSAGLSIETINFIGDLSPTQVFHWFHNQQQFKKPSSI